MALPAIAALAGRILAARGVQAGGGAAAGQAGRGTFAQGLSSKVTSLFSQSEQKGDMLNKQTEGLGERFKKLGGGIFKTGFAMLSATIAADKISTALFKSRQGLAQFDAGIAGAFAKFELRELQREVAQAQATSGSTEVLGEAVSDLKDEFQPIRELGTNIANLGGAAIARLGQGLAFILKKIFFLEEINEGIKELVGQGDPSERPDIAAFNIFADRINQPIDPKRFD